MESSLEADALLLLATPSEFGELADRISGLALSGSQAVDLNQWGWMSPNGITAKLAAARLGSRVDIDGEGRQLVWSLAPNERESLIRKLRNVAENPRPGHEFLETEGDYQIIASKGEYSDAVLG